MIDYNQQVLLPPGYRYERYLGGGGMGDVYLARQERLDRLVAIKTPRIQGNTGTEMSPQRLMEEARVIALLDHPNIIRVHDCLIWQDQVYIIMEYLDGETLDRLLAPPLAENESKWYAQFLDSKGRVAWSLVARIAHDIGWALEYAHGKDIYHRDIKPSNIFLTKRGEIRLFDFSIARDIRAEGVTRTGHLIGSPPYMSPEQIKGEPTDARSDIYSLGCVLFHAATGRFPFDDTSEIMICLQHLQAEVPDPRKFSPDVPEVLRRIILRCLEKEKEDRYPCAKELAEEISRFDRTVTESRPNALILPSSITSPSKSQQPDTPEPSSEVAEGRSGSRRLPLAVAVVTLAAFAGVGYIAWDESAPYHEEVRDLLASVFPQPDPPPDDPTPSAPSDDPLIGPVAVELPSGPLVTLTPTPTATPTPEPPSLRTRLDEWYAEGIAENRFAHRYAYRINSEPALDYPFIRFSIVNEHESDLELAWVAEGLSKQMCVLDTGDWSLQWSTFNLFSQAGGSMISSTIVKPGEEGHISIKLSADEVNESHRARIALFGDLNVRELTLGVLLASEDPGTTRTATPRSLQEDGVRQNDIHLQVDRLSEPDKKLIESLADSGAGKDLASEPDPRVNQKTREQFAEGAVAFLRDLMLSWQEGRLISTVATAREFQVSSVDRAGRVEVGFEFGQAGSYDFHLFTPRGNQNIILTLASTEEEIARLLHGSMVKAEGHFVANPRQRIQLILTKSALGSNSDGWRYQTTTSASIGPLWFFAAHPEVDQDQPTSSRGPTDPTEGLRITRRLSTH